MVEGPKGKHGHEKERKGVTHPFFFPQELKTYIATQYNDKISNSFTNCDIITLFNYKVPSTQHYDFGA